MGNESAEEYSLSAIPLLSQRSKVDSAMLAFNSINISQDNRSPKNRPRGDYKKNLNLPRSPKQRFQVLSGGGNTPYPNSNVGQINEGFYDRRFISSEQQR